MPPWRSGQGRRTYIDKFVSQHLSDLTTSVAVVLVVSGYFNN